MKVICPSCNDKKSFTKFCYELNSEFPIYECSNCFSLFNQNILESQYKELHKNTSNSYYSSHYESAKSIKKIISHNLKKKRIIDFYSNSPKHQFVLRNILKNKFKISVLEVGCSSGHFVASIRALGHEAIGIDISEDAVNFSKNLFGSFFYNPKELEVLKKKFDLICILGTIGCVENPIQFIHGFTKYLKNSNSTILLNCANREYLYHSNQKWHSTLPPDLNIIFEKRFWNLEKIKKKFIVNLKIEYFKLSDILSNLKYGIITMNRRSIFRNIIFCIMFIFGRKTPHPYGLMVKLKLKK